MNALVAELGTKIADRWLKSLLAPGVLWVAVLTLGLIEGKADPFAVTRLNTWLNNLAARPSAHAPGSILIVVAGVAAVSSAIGLLAGLLGTLVEQLWGSQGRRPPAAWLLRARRRLWDTMASPQRQAICQAKALQAEAARHAREAENPSHNMQELHEELRELDEEIDKRSRRLAWVSESQPAHPTWIGDRYARSADRFRTVNGLDDMTLVWPRLWTVLSDTLRAEITSARDSYGGTARLCAWGVLYLPLAIVWWPAALLGAGIIVTAALRARPAADNLASLVETAADLYLAELARQLGITQTSRTAMGQAVIDQLAGRESRSLG